MGNNINFLSGVTGAFDLIVNDSQSGTINGASVANLTTDAGGDTVIAGSVTTTGTQTYNDFIITSDGITLSGDVTFNDALSIDGSESVGLLNIVGGLDFGGGGSIILDLEGSSPSQHDRIAVTGTVDLSAPTTLISGMAAGGLDVGDTFTIITNDGGDATVPNSLSGVTLTAQEFSVNYDAGTGNDVVLQRQATEFEFNPDPGDNNLNDPGSWGGVLPSPGDDLVIPNNLNLVPGGDGIVEINNDFAEGSTFGQLVFSEAGGSKEFRLVGNGINLNGGVANPANGDQILAIDLNLGADQTFDSNAGSLRFQGDITGDGMRLVLKGNDNQFDANIGTVGAPLEAINAQNNLTLSGAAVYAKSKQIGAGLAIEGDVMIAGSDRPAFELNTNASAEPNTPLVDATFYRDLDSEGDLVIDVTGVGTTLTLGEFELIANPRGDVIFNLNGNDISIRDVSARDDIIFNGGGGMAPTLTLNRRATTLLRGDGADIVAGGNVAFNNVNVVEAGSGRRFVIADIDGVALVDMVGQTTVGGIPVLQLENAPTADDLERPGSIIGLDLVGTGLNTFDASTLSGVLPEEQSIERLPEDVLLSKTLRDLLSEIGVPSRDPTADELRSMIIAAMFNDIGQRNIVVNRLLNEAVERAVTKYRAIFFVVVRDENGNIVVDPETGRSKLKSRRSDIQSAMQAAFNDYIKQDGDRAFDPSEFVQYLRQSATAREAVGYVANLAELDYLIGQTGVTRHERIKAEGVFLTGINPEEITAGDMRLVIEAFAQQTASEPASK